VITASFISKTYGKFTAVDDVSFTCQPGTVTGFLGPNGAGKTTTLRVLVGLTTPTKGFALVGGHPYSRIRNPGLRVGVLLDASAHHAGRTGREVLKVGAQTMGLSDHRVDEMIELVGLTASEVQRRVRDYSLGMRRRLGIAHQGLAFGLLILNSAGPIATFFVLPAAVSVITMMWKAVEDVAQWVDFDSGVLLQGTTLTSEQWAQFGVTALIWIALPLTSGLLRVLHKEVK
jgi:ABC-type taurine transport system ATPase subunit